MPKDLHDLAKFASALPLALQDAQVRGVQKAALEVTREIRGNIRAATGGDNRLSGVGRRGAKVGAKFDVRGRVNPTAIIRAWGPLQLIENDTAPHAIGPRGRRVSKRWQNSVAKGKVDPGKPVYLSGAKALRFDGKFRAGVVHPGTRGKHPFKRGWQAKQDDTRRIFADEIHTAMVKAVKA